MRILATADIHGVLSVYEWLVELVKEHEADLVVVAGDLFAGFQEEAQREQRGIGSEGRSEDVISSILAG